ncbi:elongation factor P 5-aminopentanone reductase [Clostridium sp. DL1XJH146]
MNFEGKIAVVTGSSRGIGKAIAIELAASGATVVLNYQKNDDAAKNVLEYIKENRGYAILKKNNVSIYEEAKELIDFTISKLGKIDILVNNAGISNIDLFMDMTKEGIDEIFNVNLKGTINVSHNVVKHMVERKSGVILNISSIWGEVGASCEVLYSTTKGGINSFTKALAKELGPSNIRVNAILPGVINTEMNDCFDEQEKQSLEEEIPLNRFGEPNEIGKAACFLCSDDASYITGSILKIDGGMI